QRRTEKLEKAMTAQLKALAIYEKLSDAVPAVADYQRWLAKAHNELGLALARQKHFAEALTALDTGLAIRQKLAEANPKDTTYTTDLGQSYRHRGGILLLTGSADRRSKAA